MCLDKEIGGRRARLSIVKLAAVVLALAGGPMLASCTEYTDANGNTHTMVGDQEIGEPTVDVAGIRMANDYANNSSHGPIRPGPNPGGPGLFTPGGGHGQSQGQSSSSSSSVGSPSTISDIRVKRDIVRIATLKNGLGLYRFRYKWSDQLYVGVMAQEVSGTVPDAVTVGDDDYLRVNYARLGLRLETWQEWKREHPARRPVAN